VVPGVIQPSASASVIWRPAEISGDDEAIARLAQWINERID
jgi:hypothetical protein